MDLRALAVFSLSLLILQGCRDDFNPGDGDCNAGFCLGAFEFRANSSGWSHVVDLDGDGKDDLVNDANMFWGTDAGLPEIEVWPYLATEQRLVAFGEIDGQAGADAVLVDGDGGTIDIYFNDGSGTLDPALVSFASEGVDQVTLTQLLGADDCPDVVGAHWAGLKKDELLVWTDVCADPVGAPEIVTIPNSTLLMLNHVTDVDGDGRDDFVRDSQNGMSTTALLTPGTNTANWNTQLSAHADGQRFLGAVADVLGSASPDAVLRDRKDLRLLVRPGNGDGTFGADVALPKLSCPWAVEPADMDGDDDIDLVVVDGTQGACLNPTNRDIAVLLNDGQGGFTLGATVQVDSDGLGHVVAGDFNGDGRMDLATGGPNAELGIVLGIP